MKVKNIINSAIRFINGLRRPSKATNMRRMKERGESVDDIRIREATNDDIPALATLHVKTWNETYNTSRGPTYNTREYQWRELFGRMDGSWFCLVVENKNREFIGFAMGKKYAHEDLPGYSGELNKIYLLQSYHRLGIGRKLFCSVVKRFLSQGISTMVLFGIAQNPTCAFHEAMGGKRLINPKGIFDGGYGWQNLQEQATMCSNI